MHQVARLPNYLKGLSLTLKQFMNTFTSKHTWVIGREFSQYQRTYLMPPQPIYGALANSCIPYTSTFFFLPICALFHKERLTPWTWPTLPKAPDSQPPILLKPTRTLHLHKEKCIFRRKAQILESDKHAVLYYIKIIDHFGSIAINFYHGNSHGNSEWTL